MAWLLLSLCIERMTLSLSATFATRGKSSQKCIPGTLVRMGSNSPRISSGASGFGSKVSCCGGPPPRKRIIQDLARPKEPDSFESWLANRSPKETPRHPSPPNRNHSRRLMDIPLCCKVITKDRLNWSLVFYNLELITKCCFEIYPRGFLKMDLSEGDVLAQTSSWSGLISGSTGC